MKFITTGLTDVGLCRPNNEDCFCIDQEIPLFLVADGMGGHAAGEVASKMAAQVVVDYVRNARSGVQTFVGEYDSNFSERSNQVASAVRLANQTLYEAAQENSSWQGMGTTLAAAVWSSTDIMGVAHVGDSRVYLIRNQTIEQITRDHTVLSEQVDRGLITPEEAQHYEFKNLITRAVGSAAQVEVELNEMVVKDRDKILLCTDGLTSMVPDDVILTIINTSGHPKAACRTLVNLANKNGGKDNISVVLIYCYENTWRFNVKKFFGWLRR